MSSHLITLATLALAIFFSPETLVAGLIVAADKTSPRLAAFAFALGGIAGITFATGLGLWIAHASGTTEAGDRHSWPGFVVRVVIASALLIIGLTRAVNAVRAKPIPEISRRPHKSSADLSTPMRTTRAALLGFAMCGLHPKVFPIAIAAGHQITQIARPGERALGIVLFAVISVIPAVTPAVLEVVNPGAITRIKDGYERVMQRHGRWITAILLLSAAAFVAHSAWEKFPGR